MRFITSIKGICFGDLIRQLALQYLFLEEGRSMDKKYGKVVKIMALGLISTLLLSSCFPGGGLRAVPGGEDKVAEARFDAVMEAIEKKDSSALKSMFSKSAAREAKNLDENIEYLFTVIQGDVKSWERQGTSLWESNEYGDKKFTVQAFFDIKTERQDYILFLVECTRDDFDADGVGLYFLSIIKAEDDQKDWGIWNGEDKPGIYKPEEE
jgi:hypothetical protein